VTYVPDYQTDWPPTYVPPPPPPINGSRECQLESFAQARSTSNSASWSVIPRFNPSLMTLKERLDPKNIQCYRAAEAWRAHRTHRKARR
jgi:hypothetical protein